MDVNLAKMVRKERQAITWPQVQAISAQLEAPHDLLVLFLAVTGVRIGEAMGLRWRSVNLEALPTVLGTNLLPGNSILISESFVRGKY